MAVSVIKQLPKGQTNGVTPVGQDLIFVIENQTAVASESRVKFCADVYIDTTPISIGSGVGLVGTFKTTPNNAGVGMFNMRNVVENYVKADNLPLSNSEYKGSFQSDITPAPIHIIDKYSLSKVAGRYMAIEFYVEYLNATDCSGNQNANVVRQQCGTEVTSPSFFIFNGYVSYEDDIFNSQTTNPNIFGYDADKFILTDSNSTFLSNAPTTQYANLEDYGTVSFITGSNNFTRIKLSYYNSAGVGIGDEVVAREQLTGAYDNYSANSQNNILYFGCFPANLQNWSSIFQNLVTAGTIQGGYYTVQAFRTSPSLVAISQLYTINVNCVNLMEYEPIRLCWLNQWGAWDYYTFTQKSVRTMNTQGSTYTQLGGSWNLGIYRTNSFQGGKKSFRVNTTERITMNTDFIIENENTIFEELINSPEVYLLKGYQDITETNSSLNTYVTPVRLTTSSFTRKTRANDQLLQYTFEIEKSKTFRTQAV